MNYVDAKAFMTAFYKQTCHLAEMQPQDVKEVHELSCRIHQNLKDADLHKY